MLHSLWILAATFFTVLTYVFVKWVPPQYEIWDIFFVRSCDVLEASRRGGRTDFPHSLLVFCGKSGHFCRGGGVLEQSLYEGPFYGPHAFCRGHLHDGRSARTDIRMGTRPAAALRLSAVFRHFVCRLFRLALF